MFHTSQFPVSHGKRNVPKNNQQLGPRSLGCSCRWRSRFEVGSVLLRARLPHACQEGPSSCVTFRVSQGSLCKGTLSLPASYRGYPRVAALVHRLMPFYCPSAFLLRSSVSPEALSHSHISQGAPVPSLDAQRLPWFPEPPLRTSLVLDVTLSSPSRLTVCP